MPSCSPEKTFLCRLLQEDCIPSTSCVEITKHVEDALSSCRSSTLELMKNLKDTVEAERLKIRNIEQRLQALTSAEG